MQNRLTIKDIARLSGVGKSTVSRVLNNEGSVSPQTRERVEAVIRQQGFTPSKSARAMRGQSDKVVGIIVSRLDSPSENQAVRTMLPLLYQHSFDPIVMESQFETRLVEEHLHVLQQRNVDGVILFGFTGLTAAMLSPWQEKMVVLAREYDGFSSVCYDDDGAVRLLMERLHQQGHRHISYLGVQLSDATTGLRRHQAYLDACRQRGISPHVALGELSYQSGFQLAASAIEPQTTALVCASDTIALGAIKYLQQQHIAPLQVCGIGNTPLLNFLFPETFSVDLGYGSAGLQAAQQLLGQLSGEQGLRQIIVPSKLA
ncbi:Trehalose operon repressor [Serratia liquefaciens]|uniref:trehalose operon repressor TreR n=1 Tax=Serratia liquefaciens TaxID=614 RepID=UPI002178527C|nr:trehalose operon repressor TreR [Serratia liquefaciens]CAI1095828.1 Trehalose operon repressor [Serratia liquefaciens]CAI1762818.1 Trehalose operon repressor [Serratia liquefaciens]